MSTINVCFTSIIIIQIITIPRSKPNVLKQITNIDCVAHNSILKGWTSLLKVDGSESGIYSMWTISHGAYAIACQSRK